MDRLNEPSAFYTAPALPVPVQDGRSRKMLRATMILSALLICLWLLTWIPVARRPALLEWFLFWFGNALDLLFVPAVLALWWSSYRSHQPDDPAE